MPNVLIYDLRHTFASSGVALGQGLPNIGKLLGHSQPQTTARYAHLAATPAREVADKIS
jgi:site-specific recombinase XerD